MLELAERHVVHLDFFACAGLASRFTAGTKSRLERAPQLVAEAYGMLAKGGGGVAVKELRHILRAFGPDMTNEDFDILMQLEKLPQIYLEVDKKLLTKKEFLRLLTPDTSHIPYDMLNSADSN
eukprot:GHVT01068139.1.p1 GENE.GHVT01068139.1~~GHVT01068139.1.p1  ORF type:complete len:123 (+),score=26.62 GHVT01068139.1:444-812(+)